MLVSCILLTTHPKRAHFLPDALRSYRQQTHGERELVVINDGSPIASPLTDVRVFNLPNIGRRWTIGEKRNVGVRMAKGEYVATWDDDDISFPHRLTSQVRAAEQTGADYLLADRMFVADQDMNVMGDCDRGKRHVVMPSAMIRRAMILRSGGYPVADYREDATMLWTIKHLLRGKVHRMLHCDWYVLRRHGGNVTLSYGEQNQAYLECGLRGANEQEAARMVRELQASAGGYDVVDFRT